MTQTFQPVINFNAPSQAFSPTIPAEELGSLAREETAFKPKLLIDFERSQFNVVHAEHMRGNVFVAMIYVRVRVQNTGSAIAKGCRVYLTAIKEVYPSGVVPVLDDSRVLAWAGWKFSPIDIPPDGKVYADVVRVSKDERGWLFSIEQLFAHEEELKDYAGTFRFSVMAVAENAAMSSCELDVTYNGDWHSLRAMPVAK